MISTKKLATIGAAAAIFAATAVPAFAGHFGGGQSNFAGIWNSVFAVSNTGGNDVNGEVEDSNTDTGNAGTLVGVTNLANANLNVSSCGCRTSQRNTALIGNKVFAVSNTGGNDVYGEVEDSDTDTGDATTIVEVANVVNKNVSFGFSLEDGGIN